MESLNPYLKYLIPLTSLASQVEDFASYCLPDFVYTTTDTRDLSFVEIDLGPFLGDSRPINVAAASMTEQGETVPYIFTRWSRSQLLSHLGTREKWFETVTRPQEVSELNIRLHALRRFTLKTMRSFDSPDLRLMRGIVSGEYADLPDTAVMKSLLELMPEGYAVQYYSGKTDRAFYAYALTGERITIPGTSFLGFPGVLLKNSEVGYTSLWVIPMVYFPRHGVPIVLKKQAVLRRIHRGDVAELTKKFAEAMEKTKALWGPLEERLARLRTIDFPDEDTAVAAMTRMLESRSVGAKRYLVHACEQAYRAAHHTTHDAFGIFEAVLTTVQKEDDKDRAYLSTELAGAVLLQLLK